MNTKRFSVYLIILSIQFSYCSFFNKPAELNYDEIVYSEYRILAGSTDHSNDILKDQYSGRAFLPITVLKLNKNGGINFFHQALSEKNKSSYFKSKLSNLATRYFNTLLDSIQINNIDSIYYKEHPGMIYDGAHYYLSFRKDKKIVSSHIFYLDDSSKEIKRFIEFLNYFLNKSKFDSVDENNLFDKDFKQIFESSNRLFPIKLKSDIIFKPPIPSVEDFKQY